MAANNEATVAANGSEAPLKPLSVTFLGTSSGSGPIVSRNCSSLALNMDGDLWLFDCAEGTQMQLQHSKLKLGKISRIFITHIHVDHCLGLVPLLATLMSGVTNTPESLEAMKAEGTSKKPTMNIYGAVGLRRLLRQTFAITECNLSNPYAVHELVPDGAEPSAPCTAADLGVCEAPGRDLRAGEDGCWRDLLAEEKGGKGKGKESAWRVDAGPIDHRVPSLGYVITEPPIYDKIDLGPLFGLLDANRDALARLDPPVKHPRSIISRLKTSREPYTLPSGDVLHPPPLSSTATRKVAILGDCSGTSNEAFYELCRDASLLVHECTNAWIPEGVEKGSQGKQAQASDLDQSLVEQVKERMEAAAEKDKREARTNEEGRKDTGVSASKDSAGSAVAEREKIENKARSRGHSTPQMVGAFARDIRARRLALNHFSVMFPSPRHATDQPFPSLLAPAHPGTRGAAFNTTELHRRLIMAAIETQTSLAWAGCPAPTSNAGRMGAADLQVRASAARDYMTVEVPAHDLTLAEREDVRRANVQAEEVSGVWAERGPTGVGEVFGVRIGGVDRSGQGDDGKASPGTHRGGREAKRGARGERGRRGVSGHEANGHQSSEANGDVQEPNASHAITANGHVDNDAPSNRGRNSGRGRWRGSKARGARREEAPASQGGRV